jgi:hypothetical protein
MTPGLSLHGGILPEFLIEQINIDMEQFGNAFLGPTINEAMQAGQPSFQYPVLSFVIDFGI